MKKVILTALALVSLQFSYAQEVAPPRAGTSPKAIYDDFKDGNSNVLGVDEYSIVTTEQALEGTDPAYRGAFWSSNQFATVSRTGNGILNYSVNQPANAYEPIVVVAGEYKSGLDTLPFTFDLSANSNISFSIKNAGTSTIRVQVQPQDINNVSLAFYGEVLNEPANPWKFQIGFVQGVTEGLLPGATGIFSYNFANAIPAAASGYPHDPTRIFDYTKVRLVGITVVDEALAALTNYPIEITEFKMGDLTTITSTVDETVTVFNNETVTVYNTLGKIVATGKFNELSLEKGQLYIVRSASKTQKVILN